MLNTWNLVAFVFKRLNVESHDNVKNHPQTLMSSLRLLILSALCVNFPFILQNNVTIYSKIPQLQNIGGCISTYFANLTAHILPLIAHVSTPLPHEPKNGTCEGQPPRVESHQILKQSLHKSALKKKLRHDEDKLLHNDVFKNIGAYTSMPCEQCLRAAYFRYDLLGFLS